MPLPMYQSAGNGPGSSQPAGLTRRTEPCALDHAEQGGNQILRLNPHKAFSQLLVANVALFGLCPLLLQASLSFSTISLLSDAQHGVKPAHDYPRAMWVTPVSVAEVPLSHVSIPDRQPELTRDSPRGKRVAVEHSRLYFRRGELNFSKQNCHANARVSNHPPASRSTQMLLCVSHTLHKESPCSSA